MPKLLRLRICNIGPDRARMEDITLRLEDIVTGQATHTAILLRNGGGKTTLISLILWLLCPDRPMPDTNKIDDFVKSNDRSVLVAEWQMDQQPSLWTGKPQRYLTGVFCEWRSTASQEGKKLQRFYFAARVIEDEPRLTLERLPLYVTRQGQPERRNLAGFRQEWKELDNAYPQAEVEYTDTLAAWREILERIGVDPELFRYQIRMNTREGGAAEPFMFKENERFIDFFLELMGEAATGNEIAATITSWRQALLDLRQRLEPEDHLLQTLTQQLVILCEVADERDRLYHQIGSIHQEINGVTCAVQKWIANWRQEQDRLHQQEKQAHEEHLRLKNEANQRRRRALLLRYWAARKQVQRLQAEAIELDALVQDKKRQHVIWQAAIPLRTFMRARTKAESIEKQLKELLREHEPLLQALQESARRYAAALSAKAAHLRGEERLLRDLAKEQRTQAVQLRARRTEQLVEASKHDTQANTIAEKLSAFHALKKQLEARGILQADESWEHAQNRLLHQQAEWLKEQRTLESTKDSLHLLEHTFAHYSTAWWEEHQRLLAEAQKQKSDIETQRRQREQELQYCKTQIAERKGELQQLQERLQDLGKVLTQLQTYEPQLTIDVGALQDEEYQQRAQEERCRNEAQKLQAQADSLDKAANETTQAEKQVAEEAKVIELERSRIEHMQGEAPEANPGDIPLLQDQYQSLLEQYQQKIGVNELSARRADALKEAEHAYRQFEKKLQKAISEQEVRDALNTLADPDDAEQRAEDANTAKVLAERDKRDKEKELALAEEAMQDIKKKLLTQGIDENEGGDSIPESEKGCTEAAVEEERQVSSCEQAAQQQRAAEQAAQQHIKECSLQIESLGRVQNQVQTMQHGYASLLATVSTTEAVPDLAELGSSAPSEEAEIAYQPGDIDHTLREIADRLKHMQEEKERLDRRSRQCSQIMSQALNEVSREFKEVTLAKHLLEYGEGGLEQHCRTLFPELSQRQSMIQEQRKNLQVSRDIHVQQLLALADAGIAFLNSAAKHSRLPATLPVFEQRPFLRIHLTEPASKEERVGKIADLLDTIVREKEVPNGIALLQQAVRRLASPINVQILLPDPADQQYVPPTRMMKESGGERLTSMVLLYCTLLRMRAAHRIRPRGKTGCLILDNPIGVASRAIFLELQREVAEAMNIQLIYTTAIKDFEALHVFPNIIRIRNDQLDRRTGYHLMMHDTSPEGLEAIRIMHSESRDFSREHQDHQS